MFELDSNAKHPEHGICDNINSRGRFRKKTNLSCSAVVAIELRAVGVGLRHVCAGSDRGLCPREPTGGVDVGKGGREHVKGRFRGEGADESCDGLQRWVDWVSEHDCAWGGAGAGQLYVSLSFWQDILQSHWMDFGQCRRLQFTCCQFGQSESVCERWGECGYNDTWFFC